MIPKNSFTFTLAPPQRTTLADILKVGNYRPAVVPHAIVAVRTPDCSITLYQSGKCLVQGKGAADFVTFVLEPLVLQSAHLGYEDILDPEALEPHMGVDESGKGDFFGPLVVASAFSDRPLVAKMQTMGVKDSKRITSDNKALALGRELRRLLDTRFAVVKIGPDTYNRLYAQMKNVNTMLGWAHARAIENLLGAVPSCPRAISDKFGNEKSIQQALMRKGREIKLVQRHKAESDMAVAAASVVARDLFLRELLEMEKKFGVKFPKGASPAVKETAVELVKKHGPEILLQTAKCHFKTTDEVLKSLGMDRRVLGPLGQVVSQSAGRDFKSFRRRPSATPPTQHLPL